MNTATYITFGAIERVLGLFGLDAHIQRDDPRCGLFDFARSEVYPMGCREYWGLGMHAVVSLKPWRLKRFLAA